LFFRHQLNIALRRAPRVCGCTAVTIGMDDADLAQFARYIQGRETGDHLAMVARVPRLLAVEIQK